MAPSGVRRTSADSSAGLAGTLAAVSGGLLLLLGGAVGLLALVELVARYGFDRLLHPLELGGEAGRYLGLGIAGVSLLALPAALAAPFVRVGNPPLRSHSALALVPGCLLAIAAAVIGIVATFVTDTEAALRLISESAWSFGEYTLLTYPLVVAASAIIGGARTPEATAAAAAPALLAALISTPLALSGALFLSVFDVVLLAAAPIACAATAVLYAVAPARAVTPWLLGWVLLFAFSLSSTVIGVFTPTETAGLLTIFAIVIALPVRRLVLKQPLAPMLRQLGMETIAITSCIVAATCVYTPLTESGLLDAVVRAAGSGVAVIALVAAGYFVLAYLLTPFLTLALLLFVFPLLQGAGLGSVSAGAMFLLLGAAAAIGRAGRSPAEAASHVSLSRTAARTLAALLVALGIGVVFVLQTVMPSLQAPGR